MTEYTLYSILLNSDLPELRNWYKTNTTAKQILDRDAFWREKGNQDFGVNVANREGYLKYDQNNKIAYMIRTTAGKNNYSWFVKMFDTSSEDFWNRFSLGQISANLSDKYTTDLLKFFRYIEGNDMGDSVLNDPDVDDIIDRAKTKEHYLLLQDVISFGYILLLWIQNRKQINEPVFFGVLDELDDFDEDWVAFSDSIVDYIRKHRVDPNVTRKLEAIHTLDRPMYDEIVQRL